MRLYNLGVACGSAGDATNFYRAMGPLGPLRKMTSPLMLTQMHEVQWTVLKNLDGVFMHRPFTADHLALCRMVKSYRKPLWLDHDDNLFQVGIDNPVYQDYANDSVKKNIAEMLMMADVVSVSTPYLGEVYGRFAKKVVVIPNALDDDLFDVVTPPNESTPMVFWRGSSTHVKDWASIGGAFVDAAAKHTDWKYGFMGYQPWNVIEGLGKVVKPDNILTVSGCDIVRYFGLLRKISPKIMVVPLFPGPFNSAKSNIAWLEASYAGAVTVAPNWEEWTHPGVTNYDTANPEKSFADAMDSVMSMTDADRQKLRQQSWHHINSNLLLSRVNQLRKNVLTTYMGM